jgi:cytochrome P450
MPDEIRPASREAGRARARRRGWEWRSRRDGAEPVRGPGAALWFARFFFDPLRTLRRVQRERGPVFAVGNVVPLPRPEIYHVIALGPDANRQVLGDPALFRTTGQGVGGPRGSAQRRLRYGLTRSQRGDHRLQREYLLPPFQKRAVDATCDRMVAIADKVFGEWTPGAVIDAWREMRRLTLHISSDILFARDDPERSHRLGEMIGEWMAASFSAGVWAFMFDVPGSRYRWLLRRAEAIEREILVMVDEKRAAGAGGDDVVSRLVRAHDAGEPWMDATDLVGQTTILFGASYETTATALTWTLFLLAQHPSVSDALAEENEAALRGGPPTLEALGRMPLLDAAIREAMRILPPVPYTIRAVTGDARIGDYALRHGDRVICSHYVTHHLPELYPEPERFRPERWFGLRRSQYEYLPFSAGPRMCIGPSFATLAMQVSLALLLQRFRPGLIAGTRVDPRVTVTMSPRGGLPVRLWPAGARAEAVPVRGRIRELVDLPQ